MTGFFEEDGDLTNVQFSMLNSQSGDRFVAGSLSGLRIEH